MGCTVPVHVCSIYIVNVYWIILRIQEMKWNTFKIKKSENGWHIVNRVHLCFKWEHWKWIHYNHFPLILYFKLNMNYKSQLYYCSLSMAKYDTCTIISLLDQETQRLRKMDFPPFQSFFPPKQNTCLPKIWKFLFYFGYRYCYISLNIGWNSFKFYLP